MGAARSVAAARRWRLLASVLLIPLLSCGDGDGDGDGQDAAATEPTAGTLELAPSSTTTTTPADLALSQLLLEELPLEGFTRADDVVGAGPLDLDGAATAEDDPAAERDLLQSLGYQRGVSRAWVDLDQSIAYLAVYELGSAEDAAAYLDEGVERLRARGATTFDVPEVDGAVGITTVEEGPEETFTAHAVSFTRGSRWVLALVGSPGAGRPPEDVRAVAAAQAERLDAPPS